MISATDTNIPFDLLQSLNMRRSRQSLELLRASHEGGGLVICDAVFAELGGGFAAGSNLASAFVDDFELRLTTMSERALLLAGTRWYQYRNRPTGFAAVSAMRDERSRVVPGLRKVPDSSAAHPG